MVAMVHVVDCRMCVTASLDLCVDWIRLSSDVPCIPQEHLSDVVDCW